MDSNTLYLDPDPEFLPNLDPEPVIGSGTPVLTILTRKTIFFKNKKIKFFFFFNCKEMAREEMLSHLSL